MKVQHDSDADVETGTDDITRNSSVDESMIDKQHQFQMFPTPDEKHASKVIKELED